MQLYRAYFNRLNEAPTIWSLDEGQQVSEINIAKVRFLGCDVETGEDLSETVNRDRPKAWVQARGVLSMEHGVAVIRGPYAQKDGAPHS